MRVDNLPPGLTQQNAPPAAAPAPRDEFLRLLVAQLEHQDPLSPQDPSDFVAQLAQFSSLEQATVTNKLLEDLGAAQDGGQRAALTQLVGRGITANADNITLDPSAGELPDLSVHLDSSASNVEVVIKDEAGREVRRIQMGAHGAGDAPLSWDGTGNAGEPLPAGKYTIEIEAKNAQGGDVSAHAQLHGRVHSVRFDDGNTTFAIGGTVISPGDIISVEE